METRLTLHPGQRGTKKLVAQYGDRLVCVRYRYDERQKKRIKTVELIIEEIDWEPDSQRIAWNALVGVHIDRNERSLQRQVKQAGGKWNPVTQVWELPYKKLKDLGLEDRMQCRNAKEA